MHKKSVILAGLIALLVLLTFPVWYNLAAGEASEAPTPKLPENEKACVQDTATMKVAHMDLLMEWRDDSVRRHDRTFVMPDGREFEKSLTRTCLKCHTSKKDFCDACHDYSGVKPYCWDCHVDPKEGAR